MPEATVLNARQEQSHGTSESTGRDWTRTDLFDGNGEKYGTFNEKHAAVILATAGKKVDIAWDVKGKHKNLTSVAEHIETPKAGGSRYDDPATQHKITIQACMKIAEAVVDAPSDLSVDERVKRIKYVAAQLAVWVDEYAERAAAGDPFEPEVPFNSVLDTVDDGIEFAPEIPRG